jgi:hypothetical protein
MEIHVGLRRLRVPLSCIGFCFKATVLLKIYASAFVKALTGFSSRLQRQLQTGIPVMKKQNLLPLG